jgi:hypothetical protein
VGPVSARPGASKRVADDESVIEPQPASTGLVFSLQGEVPREWEQHSVADGAEALVAKEVCSRSTGSRLTERVSVLPDRATVLFYAYSGPCRSAIPVEADHRFRALRRSC